MPPKSSPTTVPLVSAIPDTENGLSNPPVQPGSHMSNAESPQTPCAPTSATAAANEDAKNSLNDSPGAGPVSKDDPKSENTPTSPAGKFFAVFTALSTRSKLRIIFCLVSFILIVSLSISIGYTQRTHDLRSTIPYSQWNGSRTIAFELSLVKIDLDVGITILDWNIFDSACDYDGIHVLACPRADRNATVDIYGCLNYLSSVSGDPIDSGQNSSDTQIFRYNATSSGSGTPDLAAVTSFRTVLKVTTDLSQGKEASLSSFQNYPFDAYVAHLYMFALDSRTGEHVTMTLPKSEGVAVGFKAVGQALTPRNGDLWVTLRISRAEPIKAFVIVIVTAVWLVTLIFTFLTICVICGYQFNISLLLVPIVTLFTITQLRSSMPGAPPGFGAIIDFVGTLPCLALTSMSATVIITILVFRTPSHPAKDQMMTLA